MRSMVFSASAYLVSRRSESWREGGRGGREGVREGRKERRESE